MSRIQRLNRWVLISVRALRRNDAVRSFAVALAVIVAVVAASCDKVPLTSPTGSTIQLSASTNIVPVDGSAEITATVIESAGTAVQNGTTVVFRTDLGRMDPPESQTVNGRAISRYFASGMSGVARINAYSGAAATGGTTPTNSSAPAPSTALTLLVGGAAASRITLRAEPPNIPQTGGTIQIFANISDVNGSPVLGAPVTFSITTGGTGGTAGTGVLGSPSTQTNASGVAQTSLTTNQTTTVTATVATAASTGAVTANIVVTALPVPTLTLNCTPPYSVGVPISCAIAFPATVGATPVQSVTVNWGDGTGEQPQGSGSTTVSHTYSVPGTYTVTAAATDLNSQRGTAVTTLVVQRVLPTVTLAGLPATATAGSTVTGTVTAAAGTGGPPIQNVRVSEGGTQIYSGTGGGGFSRILGSAGTYTFQATATDAAGSQGTTSVIVVVGARSAIEMTLDAASTTSNPYTCNPSASYPKTCSGADLRRNIDVSLTAGFVATAPTNVTSYQWDFGDGRTRTTTTRNTAISFPASGTRVVTVTVTTADGGSGSQQITLNVAP